MTAGATSSPVPSRSRELLSSPHETPSRPSAPLPFFATQAVDVWRRDGDVSSSCPTPTGTPNELVVAISSAVTISDFSSLYPSTAITQFQMTYTTLADGSLLAPPFITEMHQGNWLVLFNGMMLMLFARNTIVSIDYIRRGRVKYKSLFYTLLASQVFGIAAHVAFAATYVVPNSSCIAAYSAASVLTEVSSALLLSFILGVKAYRCLNNSIPVLVTISILQAASSGLSFASIAEVSVQRNLGFSCQTSGITLLFSIATALRSILSLFICLCFLYALAKSIRFPAAQGRISLRLSSFAWKEPIMATENEKEDSNQPRPRGWWDYVPSPQRQASENSNSHTHRAQTWHLVDDQGFIYNMRMMFGGWIGDVGTGGSNTPQVLQEKQGKDRMPREQEQQQASQKSRRSTVCFSSRPESSNSRISVSVRSPSPAPSKARSLSSLMDRMKPFRELMKNELAHTALITFCNVVATILGLVGAFGHVRIPEEVFVSSYWAILSLLVIHSFGRVIVRLEREALLHNPSIWDPLYHVEEATNGKGKVRPGLSSPSVASNTFRGKSMAQLGLFPEGSNERLSADGNEGASRNTMDVLVSGNPFADFESATGTQLPYRQAESSEAIRQPQRAESIGSSILLPDAPQLAQTRADTSARGSRALLLRPMSETSSSSEYSFGSSNRQSLFYLEKH